jgi:hypothetical protein
MICVLFIVIAGPAEGRVPAICVVTVAQRRERDPRSMPGRRPTTASGLRERAKIGRLSLTGLVPRSLRACYAALVRVFALKPAATGATDGLGPAHLGIVRLMLSPVVGPRQELIVNPHLEREGDHRRLLPTETELPPRRGPASWLGRRRFRSS